MSLSSYRYFMTLIWPFLVPLCLVLATNKPEKINMYENSNDSCVTVVKYNNNSVAVAVKLFSLDIFILPRSHID